MKNYKTLYFLNCCGLDVLDHIKEGRYNLVKGNISNLSDYELQFYHYKVLRMPVRTYEKTGLIMAILHNAIAEAEEAEQEQITNLKEQHRQKLAEAERAETVKEAFKIIFICCGLVLCFCLGGLFILWFMP